MITHQSILKSRELLHEYMIKELVWTRCVSCFFFQAEDGIRDLVRSRGLGDVYKRQHLIRIIAIQLNGFHLPDLDAAIAHGRFGIQARHLSLIHI